MKQKKLFNDQRLANIFRWWSVSAVFFFIGWGTGLGFQSTSIDFVFFMGVAIAVFEMFIVNPIIYSMFNVKNPLRLDGNTIKFKVKYRMIYFFKTIFIVTAVVFTYQIINYGAISLSLVASDKVFLPAEPILFGIFYMCYFLILESLTVNTNRRMKEHTQ